MLASSCVPLGRSALNLLNTGPKGTKAAFNRGMKARAEGCPRERENEHVEKREAGSQKGLKFHGAASALGSWNSPGQEPEAWLLKAVVSGELPVERRSVFDA